MTDWTFGPGAASAGGVGCADHTFADAGGTAPGFRLRRLHELGAAASELSPSPGVPVHDEASLCEIVARVRDAVE